MGFEEPEGDDNERGMHYMPLLLIGICRRQATPILRCKVFVLGLVGMEWR